MKKLFLYLIIRLTTRHAVNAIKIYESIYHKQPTPNKPTKKPTLTKIDVGNVCKDIKKQEVIDSLKYLKSKDVKTKQDKSSISMLEGVLASMS